MCFVMSNGGSRAEPAVLEARGIGRRFGHNPPLVVLGGLDLTVEGGQSVAVLGESGVGKSTLLHVLAAIDPADEGDVFVEGRSLSEMTGPELAHMRSRSIGLIFQFHNLLGDFDAVENVMLPLLVGGQGRAVARRRALEALDQVGLSERMSHRPGQLSGGEQQRVQLARVLAQVWQPTFDTGPCWLFLDEPVASLDIGHQLGIMQLARDYAVRGGGVIAVMHDLNLTAMFADLIAVMKAGRIIAHGPPGTVMTDAILSDAYGCRLRTSTPPPRGMRYVLPQSAGRVV